MDEYEPQHLDMSCPKCGACDARSQRCERCGGDGTIDDEDDPLDGHFYTCNECAGRGRFHWCVKCGYNFTAQDFADDAKKEQESP